MTGESGGWSGMSDATGAGSAAAQNSGAAGLVKAPTGIGGFDEITRGGLPRGRATLVTGGAGTGKTLFGLEFLVWGAREFGEPGVLLSFEESAAELATNVASLGFDLPGLEREGLLAVDAFRIDAGAIVAGGFDLEGLFIRLGSAMDTIGAKRVVLDTVEVLFTALGSESTVRAELSRLLRWLKDRGLTVVITGERGRSGELTRYGIEEYVSDCVVVLDDRIQDELATRLLRVAKYRGSLHGTNEYPFVITDRGMVVLPITAPGSAAGRVHAVDGGAGRDGRPDPSGHVHLGQLHDRQPDRHDEGPWGDRGADLADPLRAGGVERVGGLVADGHLAAAAKHRTRRRTQPAAVRDQEPWLCPFQPDSRVRADRPGRRARRTAQVEQQIT